MHASPANHFYWGIERNYIATYDLLLCDLKLTSILELDTMKTLRKILRTVKAFILAVFGVDLQIEKDDC